MPYRQVLFSKSFLSLQVISYGSNIATGINHQLFIAECFKIQEKLPAPGRLTLFINAFVYLLRLVESLSK